MTVTEARPRPSRGPSPRTLLLLRFLVAGFLSAWALRGVWFSIRAVNLDSGGATDSVQAIAQEMAAARAGLPDRVGFCSDVDPSLAARMSPQDVTSERVALRFIAQYALAPVVLVPVLGQPSNGQRDPSEADRAARLAELSTVLVAAGPGSRCWNGAAASGLRPARFSGRIMVFERKGE